MKESLKKLITNALNQYVKYWNAHGVDWVYEIEEKVAAETGAINSVKITAGLRNGPKLQILYSAFTDEEEPEAVGMDVLKKMLNASVVKLWETAASTRRQNEHLIPENIKLYPLTPFELR